MLRKLVVAACAAGLAAASLAFGAPGADAHGRNSSQLCVVVQWRGAWLYTDYNRCNDCCCRDPGRLWIQGGRAFRAQSQEGDHVRVWNLQARGRINHDRLRLEDESYCAAAGI